MWYMAISYKRIDKRREASRRRPNSSHMGLLWKCPACGSNTYVSVRWQIRSRASSAKSVALSLSILSCILCNIVVLCPGNKIDDTSGVMLSSCDILVTYYRGLKTLFLLDTFAPSLMIPSCIHRWYHRTFLGYAVVPSPFSERQLAHV